MPDKNLTDSEIIKALKKCEAQKTCSDCTYFEKIGCKKLLYQDALDLINRLQAENEKLKEKSVEDDKLLNERVIESVNAVSKAHLKYENALEEQLKTAKAEAYKEFAELLHCQCESIINQPHNENVRTISWKVAYEEFDEKVDNLLKELVGESGECKD